MNHDTPVFFCNGGRQHVCCSPSQLYSTRRYKTHALLFQPFFHHRVRLHGDRRRRKKRSRLFDPPRKRGWSFLHSPNGVPFTRGEGRLIRKIPSSLRRWRAPLHFFLPTPTLPSPWNLMIFFLLLTRLFSARFETLKKWQESRAEYFISYDFFFFDLEEEKRGDSTRWSKEPRGRPEVKLISVWCSSADEQSCCYALGTRKSAAAAVLFTFGCRVFNDLRSLAFRSLSLSPSKIYI